MKKFFLTIILVLCSIFSAGLARAQSTPQISASVSSVTDKSAQIAISVEQFDQSLFPISLDLAWGKVGEQVNYLPLQTGSYQPSDIPFTFNVPLSGLDAGSDYAIRVINAESYIPYTNVESFKTLGSSVGNSSVYVSAPVISYLGKTTDISQEILGTSLDKTLNFRIEYGATDFSSQTGSISVDDSGKFDVVIGDLLAGTMYQYRVADASGKLKPSGVQSFQTTGYNYVDAISSAAVLNDKSATISGYLNNENPQTLSIQIEYGKAGAFNLKTAALSINSKGQFTPVALNNLSPATAYQYRFVDTTGSLKPSNQNGFTTFSTATVAAQQPPSVSSTPSGGLVPCTDNCDWTSLMTLIDKFIKYLVFYLSLPIAAIVFFYAGFLLMTSGGDSGARTKAKNMFIKVGIGLVIAMAAWLIVNTILTTLIDKSQIQNYSLLQSQ